MHPLGRAYQKANNISIIKNQSVIKSSIHCNNQSVLSRNLLLLFYCHVLSKCSLLSMANQALLHSSSKLNQEMSKNCLDIWVEQWLLRLRMMLMVVLVGLHVLNFGVVVIFLVILLVFLFYTEIIFHPKHYQLHQYHRFCLSNNSPNFLIYWITVTLS